MRPFPIARAWFGDPFVDRPYGGVAAPYGGVAASAPLRTLSVARTCSFPVVAIARSRHTGLVFGPAGRERCAHRHGAGPGRPRAGRRRRLRPPPHRRPARPRRGGRSPCPVLGPREAAERLHALKPDLAHVQFAPSAFGFSGASRAAAGQDARLALRHDPARVRLVGLPAVGAGRGVAAAGAGPAVGPRDLALRPPQQRGAHHERRPLARAAGPVRPHGRAGAARSQRAGSVGGRGCTGPRRSPAPHSACPSTPRSSRSSGSCTRSRACATSSRRWPGCAAPGATASTC